MHISARQHHSRLPDLGPEERPPTLAAALLTQVQYDVFGSPVSSRPTELLKPKPVPGNRFLVKEPDQVGY